MKKVYFYLITLLIAGPLEAAKITTIWGNSTTSLPPIVTATMNAINNNPYALKKINLKNNTPYHIHYQITYQEIPVWGQQLTFHYQGQQKPWVTGYNVTDIDKDIQNIKGKLSKQALVETILSSYQTPIKFKQVDKVIFIDSRQKAHLAYHLSFYTRGQQKPVTAPNYIVDANHGTILKHWDNIHEERAGQGLGGNAFNLPYRSGAFQYGNSIQGLPALGAFDVDVIDGNCLVQNDSIVVMNLTNAALGFNAFPISIEDESSHKLTPFAYPCSEDSFYLNLTDGGTGPINYTFSPINDTMFFAQNTIEMYTTRYKIEEPLGKDLPLRAFTHIGEMDNAFALSTLTKDGVIIVHQQIVIGNGADFLTAPSQSAIGHELSHLFTDLNSGLIYAGQSGGINEAFSDMTSIALMDYLRTTYPWYWDGKDWTIAREAVISGEPLRYMDDPTKDGKSIAHAKDYNDTLNVHHSSGVFNKAFYLLARMPGWSIRKAFQAMIDANRHYWQPTSDFDFASCGVIQAAMDRGLDPHDVINAFAEVGVDCKNISHENFKNYRSL